MAYASEGVSVAAGKHFQNCIVLVFRKRRLKLRKRSQREYEGFHVQLLFVDLITVWFLTL